MSIFGSSEGEGRGIVINLGVISDKKTFMRHGGVARKNYRRGGPADWGAEANQTGAYSSTNQGPAGGASPIVHMAAIFSWLEATVYDVVLVFVCWLPSPL